MHAQIGGICGDNMKRHLANKQSNQLHWCFNGIHGGNTSDFVRKTGGIKYALSF